MSEPFADIRVEGDTDPFKDIGEKTPTESQPEKEQGKSEEQKPEGGDNTSNDDQLPFHKHPRWIERDNELKELRAKQQEDDRIIADLRAFKQEIETKFKGSETADIPAWFKNLFGDNQQAWAEYKAHTDEEREQIKADLKREAEAEWKQAQEQEKYWQGWVGDQLTKLEQSGKKFDRNELVKIMLETRPTDQNGNFDFEAGYRIYELSKANSVDPAKSQARKHIADEVTKSSRGESKSKDYMTSAELRKKSWHSL